MANPINLSVAAGIAAVIRWQSSALQASNPQTEQAAQTGYPGLVNAFATLINSFMYTLVDDSFAHWRGFCKRYGNKRWLLEIFEVTQCFEPSLVMNVYHVL